jgi:2-isopropylmalate synthase
LLLVNLVMMGYLERDLLTLPAYCEAAARACDVPIPVNYPVIGADAFRTATGVHASAVLKAMRKGDHALIDAVYAAVPASLVGREQQIDIGPLSGRSNVVFWLERRGLPVSDLAVDRVLTAGKASNRTLTEPQIRQILSDCAAPDA